MSQAISIRMPDGTIVENVPNDITREELFKALTSAGIQVDDKTLGEALTIGIGAGMTRFGQGLKQAVLGVGEKIGFVEPGTTAEYTEEVKKEREFFEQTPVGKSTAGKTGILVGEVAPGMVIPGGIAGNLAQKVFTGAMGAAAVEALRFTDNPELFSGERGRNIAGGLIFGAAGTAAFQGAPILARFVGRTINELTEAGARRQVRQSVGVEDIRGDQLKAAEDIGVFITPGEASGRLDLLAREGSLGLAPTAETAKTIAQRLQTRTGKLSEFVEDTLTSIGRKDPASLKIIESGYSALNNSKIQPQTLQSILKDPLVGPMYKAMQKDKAWGKEVAAIKKQHGANSAANLDLFKRYMAEQEDILFRDGKKNAARQIADFRRNMVADLDNAIPEYKAARAIAQLNIVHDNFMNTFQGIRSKVRTVDGVPTSDALEFYKKAMKSDKDFAELLRGLDGFPEAQVKLTQARTLMEALENSPINRVFKGSSDLPGPRGTSGFGRAGAVAIAGGDFLRSRNAEKIINYITDPKYTSDLLESVDPSLLRKGVSVVYDQMSKIFTRIGAGEITPEASKNEMSQFIYGRPADKKKSEGMIQSDDSSLMRIEINPQ